MIKKPPYRKLRGYAFDPSLSLKMSTALINDITYKIPWEDPYDEKTEKGLLPGPVGEYIEVVDYDPTVKKFYSPVDLFDNYILAQDGLEPSASNPQFHQQMVYAVSMTTIKNFEAGLGRPVIWSSRQTLEEVKEAAAPKKKAAKPAAAPKPKFIDEYVGQLRIYPHAMREANAFYSPQKKSLLFGYFAAQPADITLQMPDNLTFTCLSHDIIAHETTHAILDGLQRRFIDDTNPDVLAFHEAFADIVALFQHFTFPEVLKNQIASTRGDLAAQNLLGQLAQEFGVAIGGYSSLRDAIGETDPVTKQWKPKEPTGDEYRTVMEPHDRGSILVAAVFEAFLSIYKSRIADLLRIASNGSGILRQGELHPDLVKRLADEAAKASKHVLNMCIRALDYCPPVDITFGEYLRAIITADIDLVADDRHDYRLAFIDAFRKRGIYPTGIKHLSIDSLCYPEMSQSNLGPLFGILVKFLREFRSEIIYTKDREEIFMTTRKYIAGDYTSDKKVFGLHRRLDAKFDGSLEFEKMTGLMFSNGWKELGVHTSSAYGGEGPSFTVQNLHVASRVGPDGDQANQIIITLVQRAGLKVTEKENGELDIKPEPDRSKEFLVSGGCTLIFDLDTMDLKYAISKPLLNPEPLEKGKREIHYNRCKALYEYDQDSRLEDNQFKAYYGSGRRNNMNEPFNFLHTH
ncbi:MAG: hypothetical protein U0U70_00490 [Chitinophagaceae bacterium]